jgi:ribulose-phosphate 3-epimerase
MPRCKIFPSILSADLLNLGACLENLQDCGIDGIHFDVMDNHYVPNLTFGPLLLEIIRKKFPTLFIDVHLMIQPVMPLLSEFVKFTPDQVSFHLETTEQPYKIIEFLKQHNILAGIAINPNDDPKLLERYVSYVDYILIMTVQPGFAGQKLQPKALDNIKYCEKHFPNVLRFVDGGVNLKNINKLKISGAQNFIIGSAFFNNSYSFKETLQQFYGAMEHANQNY